MDYDDSKIDDDLDKLLQHIKEEQQNSMVLFLILLIIFIQIKLSIFNFIFFNNFRMHQIRQKLNHLLVLLLEDWNQMIHLLTLMIIFINVDHLVTYYMLHIFLYHWLVINLSNIKYK